MDRSRIRVAAVSCAIACGAMVAGPGVVGSAVASADGLFGIDIDIFGHDDKKSDHVGVVVGVGQPQFGGVSGAGPRRFGAGRAPNLPPVPTAPSARSVVIRAEHPASVPAAPGGTRAGDRGAGGAAPSRRRPVGTSARAVAVGARTVARGPAFGGDPGGGRH